MNKVTGNCEYCFNTGLKRVDIEEGVTAPVYVCDSCWKLLKDPKTALPLIRGSIRMNLRGKVEKSRLEDSTNKFMDIIKDWKPRQ